MINIIFNNIFIKHFREVALRFGIYPGDRFSPEGALAGIDDKRPTITIGSSTVEPKKYINVYKQRAILSETGGKCSYPGCNKPAVNFHHADRWSITKNHDNIRPLCKEHHEFPHNGLIENENTQNWQLNINGTLKTEADVLYKKYHQEALL